MPGVFNDLGPLSLGYSNEPVYLDRYRLRLRVAEGEGDSPKSELSHRRKDLRFDDGIADFRISGHPYVSGDELPALQLRRGRHHVEQHPVGAFSYDRSAYLDLHIRCLTGGLGELPHGNDG